MAGEASTSERPGRSPRKSQASTAMMSTCRLPNTVLSPAPIAVIAWLQTTRSAARNRPASRASQRLRAGSGGAPRRRSAQARAPSTGRANAHRPRAVMLGEVSASFISTAELEMQTAPAVAAATGDTGLAAIQPRLPRLRPVLGRHAVPEVAVQDGFHHLAQRAALVCAPPR